MTIVRVVSTVQAVQARRRRQWVQSINRRFSRPWIRATRRHRQTPPVTYRRRERWMSRRDLLERRGELSTLCVYLYVFRKYHPRERERERSYKNHSRAHKLGSPTRAIKLHSDSCSGEKKIVFPFWLSRFHVLFSTLFILIIYFTDSESELLIMCEEKEKKVLLCLYMSKEILIREISEKTLFWKICILGKRRMRGKHIRGSLVG